MQQSRRDFLKTSLVGAGALAFGPAVQEVLADLGTREWYGAATIWFAAFVFWAIAVEFHVGTRARQRLYLCFAQTRMLHGQTRYNLPSRFLDEVPEELVKWLTPRAGAGGFAVNASASRGDGASATSSFGSTPRRSESSGGSGFRDSDYQRGRRGA